jgi:hypothetical protein
VTFFQATLDTEHFEFEGYGETEKKARLALYGAIAIHAKQTKISVGAFRRLYDGEVSVRWIKMGAAYRDREEIKWRT